MGNSWPLDFLFVLFYFRPSWCFVFFSRMVSAEGIRGIRLYRFLIINSIVSVPYHCRFIFFQYNKQRLKRTTVLVLNELSIYSAPRRENLSQSDKRSRVPIRRLMSDWIDAQAGLSLHLAHKSFCWFYRAAAQLYSDSVLFTLAHRERK